MGLWDIARWARRDGLIIRLIIQTILLDPSGADQIDAEHQATDLVVGSSARYLHTSVSS
jgi:hypothetical protein